ncbi:MAG: hypothetical protein WA191_23615 [Telluria sp.]|nr:hypothetical protein [Telluria sp.]
MPGIAHWIMQYLLAAGTLFLILIGVDFASGTRLEDGLWSALAWAVFAAALFVGARYNQARKGIACGPCKDDVKK